MSVGETATPIAKVRGLGPSGHGGEHWLNDKVQSSALILLGAWLLTSLLLLPALDQRTLTEWLRGPWAAVPMAVFILVSFRHGLEGMKVIVDDYVSHEGNRFALNTILLFLTSGGAGLALFALGRIAFGGAA